MAGYSGPTDMRDRRRNVYKSPRLSVDFAMSRSGIAKVAVGRELKDAVHNTVVQRAMVYAIQISPHGPTLEYVSSWNAVDGYTVIAGMRRVACKLLNSSGHAAAVEWGRGGRQRILGRTLAHLNGTSPIGLAQAAKAATRKPFDPGLHPRGSGGRFVIRPGSAAQLAAAARRAARRG